MGQKLNQQYKVCWLNFYVRIIKHQLLSSQGLLSIAHSLDHEHERLYHLNITATDHGLPALTTVQILEIRVEDVNDLPPHFDPSSYVMNVFENLDRATYVGTVVATDGDTGRENLDLRKEII